MPLTKSKAVFEDANELNVPKTSRNKVMNKIARCTKPPQNPPLTKKHMKRRVEWAKTTMKNDFSCIIFTDECGATLDGPDGWSKGWLANDQPSD